MFFIKMVVSNCNSWRLTTTTMLSMVLLALVTCVEHVHAAKILGLFAHPSEGNFEVMRGVMTELARRQHNVTVYSSHRLDQRIDNLQEHVIEPEYAFWAELQKDAGAAGLEQLAQLPAVTLQRSLARVGAAATDHFLSHASVQQLLGQAFDYDLIVVDLFYTDALLAVGALHSTPTVALVSSDFEHYMQQVLERIVPSACSPIDFEQRTASAPGYWHRLSNIRACLARRKLFARTNDAAQQPLLHKHFSHLPGGAPKTAQLHTQLALLLLNNHVPLLAPRPLLPHTLPAGGMHIRAPRELPRHLRRFLDEARDGVIYVHLGGEQLCGQLPAERLRTLLQVFGRLRQRVLWTCHDVQTLAGQPDNVLVQHAVPQSDILAHPHVKAFLTNGDVLALQEALVRHVPMLGVPRFRHEVRHVELAERLGVAIRLDYANLTESSLTWALQALLADESLPLTIRRVAVNFRDRPLGALESCMYWIDYVLRHNGGAPLATAGLGLTSSQLHLFDLFVYYAVVDLALVCGFVALCYALLTAWRRQQASKLYSKLS